MTILQILTELAATNSSIEKVSILTREKDNATLKAVFQAAYNPLVTYGIKAIPEYIPEGPKSTVLLSQALGELSGFSSREVTGNNAISALAGILTQLYRDDAIVLERIIQRDLRCGCTDTLASRVWPNLVPEFDVMLCGKDITKIKFPAYSQLKGDGSRVALFYDGKQVKALSRQGKEFHLLGVLDDAAKAFMKEGEEFDGELLVMLDGKIANRQYTNGILNKASKGTISQEEAEQVVMLVWDIVDRTSTIPYKLRLEELQRRHLSGKFMLVPNKIVATQEDAMEHFSEMLAKGEEGTIVKNIMSMWVPKRSKELCKLKAIETADLRVIGVEEGTGKNVGKLGALVCETACGSLLVNVGSGFSDEQRTEYWNDKPIGKIVEVLYNAVIKSKGKDTASLFLPRFVCVRFDKDKANILEELK